MSHAKKLFTKSGPESALQAVWLSKQTGMQKCSELKHIFSLSYIWLQYPAYLLTMQFGMKETLELAAPLGNGFPLSAPSDDSLHHSS